MRTNPVSYILVALLVFSLSFVASESTNTQFTNPSLNDLYSSSEISTYWPAFSNSLENEQCTAGTDFLISIPVGGCSPSIVRSDLLEEQNVPVFCRLSAVNVNPLINVDAIDSISYKGSYPKEVSSVIYHPAKAAAGITEDKLLNSPVVNNVGYVVIVLKKQANESAMPKWVSGNLTATLRYDAKEAFGVGQSEFYLKSVNDADWQSEYTENSFWDGKGYLRLIDVNGGKARIALYTDKDHPYTELTLAEGETSGKMYYPGYYCQAGLRVKLNSLVSDQDSALLDIDGDSVWVRQGSKFLDDACTVTKLSVGYGGAGTVTFSCRGSKAVTLSLLGKSVATFTLAGATTEVQHELGDKITSTSNNNLYLGYVGEAEKSLYNEKGEATIEGGTAFVVLISESNQALKLDNSKVTKLSTAIANFFDQKSTQLEKAKLEKEITRIAGAGAVVLYNQEPYNSNSVVTLASVDGRTTTTDIGDDIKNTISSYFESMDKARTELTDFYPQEKETSTPYGALAILEEIDTLNSMSSIGMEDSGKVSKLIELYSSLYPQSSATPNIKRSSAYDYSSSFATVYANNNYNSISLQEFRTVDPATKSATLYINGRAYENVHEGDPEFYLGAEKKSNYFIIRSIERKVVKLDYYVYNSKKSDGSFTFQTTYTLKEDEEKMVDQKSGDDNTGYPIEVTDVSVIDVARVSLIPEVATKSEANFTYKIGIEKRAIQLAPDKANETAQKLNETIKKWEDANAKLGKLIEGWKGACLLTSGILQVKTLFTGFTGASTARQSVMEIYKSKCATDETYKGMTSTQCYAKINANNLIDNDVEAYKSAITQINKDLNGISITEWQAKCGGNSIIYTDPDTGISIACKDVVSWEEVRAYLLNKYISAPGSKASSDLKKEVKLNLETKMRFVAKEKQSTEAAKQATDAAASTYKGGQTPIVQSDSSADSTVKTWDGQVAGKLTVNVAGSSKTITQVLKETCNDAGLTLDDTTPIQYYTYNGQQYLLSLAQTSGTAKQASCILRISGTGLNSFEKVAIPIPNAQGTSNVEGQSYNYLSRISWVTGTTGSCKSGYPEKNVFTVEYYESGTNKGNPAKVPFDKKNGWYVKLSSSSGSILSDNVKSYQDSGAVSYLSICNVGDNQREDNLDECTGFNINNNVNQIETVAGCKLSTSEVKSLVNDAQLAIKQAQQHYGDKKFTINVGGRGPIEVTGKEAASELGYECEDFMSADDCHILYNVCDPVICPSSRCDFGGKFKVANVIQSGIVGSMLLCLPNFGSPSNGGVVVPVCLTGIHAGIEGYISILKSSQACLLEAAKTGKHVGICDEITSIYKCEFFWRQVSPLMESLIPTLAEKLYGSATGTSTKKGGGEYLTFQDSWNNMESSIDYFKNTYASTSFRAVDFGNVEEIGTELCQNFIGTSVPTSANLVDSLLKPESPYQFYAQFSEIELNSATVPATSQYKVYYHIYAGTDQGVSYQVYLKDPPAMGYVHVSQTVAVPSASGYIPIGSQVDVSKDFSAPAGYQQLCVVINGQEECGFKQVTSDVGIELIHDAYATDQAAENNITTEKECSQGTSSALSLANLNLEEGIDEAVNPDITLRGIVRICSTTNPGEGKDDSNWKNVGYCGDKTLRCWLDQSSLNDGALEILNYTKSVAAAKEELSSTGVKVLSDEASKEALKNLTKVIGDFNTKLPRLSDMTVDTELSEMISLIEGLNLYSNTQKANLLYLKFILYKDVVVSLVTKASGDVKTETTVLPTTPEETPTAETVSTSTSTPSLGTYQLEDKNIVLTKTDGTEKIFNDFNLVVSNANPNLWIIYTGSQKIGTLSGSDGTTVVTTPYSSQEPFDVLTACRFDSTSKSFSC